MQGSLRYFGGEARLLARLREGLAPLGFEARTAVADTAQAAQWRARGGGAALEALPVKMLDLAPEAMTLLAQLGVRTLGELLALPREGIALRFGRDLLRRLDEATGAIAETREFFTPPPVFSSRLELPSPVEHAERLLFAAGRLLQELEGFLAARQAGVRRFTFLLHHDSGPDSALETGLAGPGREADHFSRLLRERLAREALAAPVEALSLRAEDLEPLAPAGRALFPGPGEGAEEWHRLVERLQARLGTAAVHGLRVRADHRPERAWGTLAPGEVERTRAPGTGGARPLWLLQEPRPLAEGGFALLAGPERIETGWWDGAEVRRDYFIARLGSASLAWVFREREGRWFLHGWFA